MLQSMTAFASAQGHCAGYSWAWDLRGLNGKGLDLRLRTPDWIEGLEVRLRARLAKALTRGTVTLGLRVQSDVQGEGQMPDKGRLATVLSALAEVEAEAMARGITLAPANAADILALRGVMEPQRAQGTDAELRAALETDFEALLESFLAMRHSEGAALATLLSGHLDEIARLTEAADAAARARLPQVQAALRAALARVMEAADAADEGRIAQELALLAVKADVTEEIDRLRAHVAAARALLADGGTIGRKLDFLAQEFNREANTLCSKSQDADLTMIGLGLKTAIDQMREQVQNVA